MRLGQRTAAKKHNAMALRPAALDLPTGESEPVLEILKSWMRMIFMPGVRPEIPIETKGYKKKAAISAKKVMLPCVLLPFVVVVTLVAP
jgi:hypothetical protein